MSENRPMAAPTQTAAAALASLDQYMAASGFGDDHPWRLTIARATDTDEEVLKLHRRLAAETLRADQGWQRYEAANRDRNELRAALASQPSAAPQAVAVLDVDEAGNALPASVVVDLSDALTSMLWLYRRLPRAYGRQKYVERAIIALAERVGTEVGEFLEERDDAAMSKPAEGNAQ